MFILLSATVGVGILSLLLLFALCFIGVHLVLLARLGFLYHQELDENASTDGTDDKNKPNDKPPPPNDKPPDSTPPEPVYYIVEKKRKTKSSYSPPKQIKFK